MFTVDQLNVRQFVINETAGIAHFIPNYPELLELGTQGLRARIEARRQDLTLAAGQQAQLSANLIALQAVEDFSDRYRELALSQGEAKVAEILTRIPRLPPRTLREALQMIWLFQLVIQIETLDQGISLGRIDQYLYPLYQREAEAKDFDPDRIRDLFCAFCIKLSEIVPLFSSRVTELFAGLPSGQAATLGGIDAEGKDASNDLSLLLLDVIDQFKTRQPNWHVRLSRQSSANFRRRVFEVVGRGGGSPALYNDEIIMPALRMRYSDAPDVWDYATVGCVEPAIASQTFSSSDAAIFNLAAVLENILQVDRKTTHLTIDAIQGMDALMDALKLELELQLDALKYHLDRIEAANRTHHPVPFASLMVQGAIETATDLTAGGARYNASGVQAVGVADLANSLAAIEKEVFRDQRCSLVELARACRDNFKGQGDLRARLIANEKFGNDQDRADHYATQVAAMFDQAISSRTNTRGGGWVPGLYSMTCHRAMGARMAALPSGRLRGEALADGSSATDGSDRLGPTALLNSVARLGHVRFGNGVNLNLKFDAATVRGEKGGMLLQALTQGYFDQGGMQVQINVLDPKVLRAARLRPQDHRNLLVRVSGYSAYFVDLTPGMQDEIIARTMLQG